MNVGILKKWIRNSGLGFIKMDLLGFGLFLRLPKCK
jgi:hypothetical protein